MTRLRWLLTTIVAGLVTLAPPARAQTADAGHAEAIEQARSALQELVRESGVPAVQAAVAVDGRIVWSEAFGFADIELQAPATTRTKFRIASISKSLTGTLAAKLAATGRLDLDAPVQQYVGAAFPQKQAPVTCRQLAGHTSGVRHYRRGETASAQQYPSLTSALVIFGADDLEHDPGAEMTYSTYGYTLLGAALEGATGAEFPALLQAEILAPLGMDATVVDDARAIIPDRAGVYDLLASGRLRRAAATDHSYKIPGGGMLSTAEDLVRFGSALLTPGVFDAATLELALTSCALDDGRETGYALGWRVTRDEEGARTFGHGGSQPGSRTYLHVDARSRVAVALLCNATGAPVNRREAVMIADLFAPESIPAPAGGPGAGAAAEQAPPAYVDSGAGG